MMIHRFRLFIIGMTVLPLVVVGIANAQRGGESKQETESKGVPDIPADSTSPMGTPRGSVEPWAPPEADILPLPVSEAAGCSLSDVVSRAGARVEEFVHNLDRFSATEIIEHQPVSRSGKFQRPEIQKFNYVYSMKEGPDGYMISDEDRDMSASPNGFPDQVATIGSPGLVLVFHPNYIRDFRMSCEGLGDWHGRPAWRVRFEELPDCLHRMSSIVVNRKDYDVRLRGIAWILADSFQVVHLEVDSAEIIPEIRLRLDHQLIDYRPVSFPQSDVDIWLPASAELYLDFRGHRFYRRLSYTNFKLFSVKVQQQFGAPR